MVPAPWRLADGIDLRGAHLVVLPHSLGMLSLHQCKLAFEILMKTSVVQASELALRMVLHICHLLGKLCDDCSVTPIGHLTTFICCNL